MPLVDIGREHLANIVAQVRARRPVTLGSDRAQSQVLRQAADAIGEDAVLIRVEHHLDAASYIPLVIAEQCGVEASRETGRSLSVAEVGTGGWRAVLERALEGRYLLVDGLERLRAAGPSWDLRGLVAPSFQGLATWLDDRAAIGTQLGASIPTMSPRPDVRWGAALLWSRVEQDPERYALAVARELLLGRTDLNVHQGWDAPSLVTDLWEGMPTQLRELIAFLAVHGRPMPRALFERLGLVQRDAIDQAHELSLIEIYRGQLSLPEPWYEAVEQLEPEPRHRALADAFAGLAQGEEADANPLAVLEAHHHYAAIPDIERALEFAKFGAGALLETAVRQSIRGNRGESAKTYEALLQLDERILAAPSASRTWWSYVNGEDEFDAPAVATPSYSGLGKRTRAYVRHYLHYNRYLSKQEELSETTAGYREALKDWPENALFWSRLVRSLFVAKEENPAMSALREAYAAVPRHQERDRVLIVRTVDRLLDRDLVLPAVFVWSEHQGRTALERSVETKLDIRLRDGWQTCRLWAEGLPATKVEPPVSMALSSNAENTRLECSAGGRAFSGSTRPAAVHAAVLALIFDVLATRWRRETGGMSVISARYKHPAWEQILSLGPEVVPEILRRIEHQPDHWHAALVKLTGENPIPVGEKITISQVCARWVSWGRERGLWS